MTINGPGDVKVLNKKRSGGAPGCSKNCNDSCMCAAHKGLSVVITEGQGKGNRLQASAKVYKDGELLKSFDMASSLPDYPYGTWKGEDVATVKEGVYGIKVFSYDHDELGNYSTPYSSSHPNSFLVYNLETGNDYYIPCYYGAEQRDGTANAILIHEGMDYRASTEDGAWSAGCILIEENDMPEFFDLVRSNMVNGKGKLYIERLSKEGMGSRRGKK